MLEFGLRESVERLWYDTAPPPLVLRAVAGIHGRIAARRRARLIAESAGNALPVPVIVVGNISVGGTGKTPFVIWLVERLREWGWRPGVISRGYGGVARTYPLTVRADSDAREAGDEPCLIARRCACPVVVAPDRVQAARALIATDDVDVLVADDGLQHYRLPRVLEFCVVDGVRGLGNGALLPAGPLREPPSRLDEVDLVIANGGGFVAERTPTIAMLLAGDLAVPLDGGTPLPLSDFRQRRVHAVAGIGHPERFFSALAAQGLVVTRHPFSDHHVFRESDFAFSDSEPVLMTEKDAIKCHAFSKADRYFVPVNADIGPDETQLVQRLVQQSLASPKRNCA